MKQLPADMAMPSLRWLYLADCKLLQHLPVRGLASLTYLDASRSGQLLE